MSLEIRPRTTWDIRALYKRPARNELPVKKIELQTCHYVARCTIPICLAQATIIARYIDVHGRPLRHYELCAEHTHWLARRESAQDWRIVALDHALSSETFAARIHRSDT
jgi:hypothetical protein